jgi:signal transduction histidine kinase
MTARPRRGGIDGPRVDHLLDVIARMAGGDLAVRAPITEKRDAIDALAFGLNLLGGELAYTLDGLRRSQTDAERANAAKEVFLRHVTHELRTPITAVILVAEALRRPELAAQKRLVLCDRLERNAQTLLRMIDHLLDLTRTQTGRLELVSEAIAPAAVAREVVEQLELAAGEKKLDLRLVVGRDAHPVVFSDAARLRQILLNVVGNAIKYTQAGRVVVRLGRTQAPAAATIDVRDTGVGIDPEDRPRLFEPFSRGRKTAEMFPGHGLGLTLSRGLARALGGELALVRSRPGRGTTFRLSLPAPTPGERPPRPAGATPRPGRSIRALDS